MIKKSGAIAPLMRSDDQKLPEYPNLIETINGYSLLLYPFLIEKNIKINLF